MTTDEDRELLRQLEEKLDEARGRVYELEEEWEAIDRRLNPPTPLTPEEAAYLGGAMRVLHGDVTGPVPEKLSDIIGTDGKPVNGWTDFGAV